GLVAPPITEGDFGPFRRELLDNRPANSAAAAGNQGHLVLQSHDGVNSLVAPPAAVLRGARSSGAATPPRSGRRSPARRGSGRGGYSARATIEQSLWLVPPLRLCP